METTTDGACPPISRAREGAGAVRLDGPTGRVDRLGEPAWRRVHPLPALGMASVRPLQDAATQRGIALEKQIRRQTSRGLMRRGRTWRTRGPRWSAGHASASKRIRNSRRRCSSVPHNGYVEAVRAHRESRDVTRSVAVQLRHGGPSRVGRPGEERRAPREEGVFDCWRGDRPRPGKAVRLRGWCEPRREESAPGALRGGQGTSDGDHVDGYAGDAEGSEGPATSPPGWEISYSTAPGGSPISSSEARCASGRT